MVSEVDESDQLFPRRLVVGTQPGLMQRAHLARLSKSRPSRSGQAPEGCKARERKNAHGEMQRVTARRSFRYVVVTGEGVRGVLVLGAGMG